MIVILGKNPRVAQMRKGQIHFLNDGDIKKNKALSREMRSIKKTHFKPFVASKR